MQGDSDEEQTMQRVNVPREQARVLRDITDHLKRHAPVSASCLTSV